MLRKAEERLKGDDDSFFIAPWQTTSSIKIKSFKGIKNDSAESGNKVGTEWEHFGNSKF